MQYLTFQCFERDIEKNRLREHAMNGYFVFQDYAVAKWFQHLHALVDAGEELFAGEPETRPNAAEVSSAMDDFVNVHQDCLLDEELLPEAQEACGPFRDYYFYNNLLSIWNHILRHQKSGYDVRNEVSIESLGKALTRNRKLLEELSSSNMDLSPFYGSMPFKCPKVTCYYFH